ncbi:MAG TPA: rod shape-determining protein MreC [bacterium]|nr:rod shape-determining protein MreC [bacterium]HPQ66237.1 rod shape-determining protein MreC [bacterium]
MSAEFRSNRSLAVPAAVALGLVVLLSLSATVSTGIREGLGEIFLPVQQVLHPVFFRAGAVVTGIGRVIDAVGRNFELEEENAFLAREVIRLSEVEKENLQLRDLLDFQQASPYRTLGARVVGRDIRHWYQAVTIDKGTRRGVRVGAGVVTGRGVVGRVIEAGAGSARVLLLIDPNCRVGSMIRSSRVPGVAVGDGEGGCSLEYLSRQAQIGEGERVVTSGLSGTFPSGIPVGTVTAVESEEHGLYQSARVAPAVEFEKLYRVLVLLENGE